jgi:hypothetical protein
MKETNPVFNEIKAIKQSLISIERNSVFLGDWLPKKAVLRFFDYGETQMRALEKSGAIVVSRIGNRKFYSKTSILQLLELKTTLNK